MKCLTKAVIFSVIWDSFSDCVLSFKVQRTRQFGRRKLVTLVLHNLKKDKGSFISFGLIVLFTSFMLCTALVLAFQVDKAYDEKFDELNTAFINVLIPEAPDSAGLADKLKAIDGVEKAEARQYYIAKN